MKRIVLALTLLLLLFIQPLGAAITKTTTVDVIDDWELVAATVLDVGAAESLSTSYATALYIEIAYTTNNTEQSGVDVLVEISYADDNWVLLTRYTTIGDTPQADAINDASCTAGDATVELDDAATDDFDVKGRKWFILDGANVANSESVRTVSVAGNVVTLAQDILRNHADSTVVYDFVTEKVISIPMAAAYVRVLINNTDADCAIHKAVRVSKVTGI